MKFDFIENNGQMFEIQAMCQTLKVSSSGFYAWSKREPSKRAQEDAELSKVIEKIHDESHQTYGYRRIYKELMEAGKRASRGRAARLMRQLERQGRQYRRYVVTTKPGKKLHEVPDRLQRQFKAERPNQAWVSDFTCVRTRQGWPYLAVVLDLFSRRVVGWSMNASLANELTLKALRMALKNRRPLAGLIHHCDCGSQYTSRKYQQMLKAHQALPSFGKVGSCFDNAAVESFFGTLKTEWLYFQRFDTRQYAMTSIFYYIESFYNHKRRHSANAYLSPLAFERQAVKQSNLSYFSVH